MERKGVEAGSVQSLDSAVIGPILCAMTLPSLWTETARVPAYAPLTSDAEADVVVVGGGIAGLTGALLLQRAGKRVILIEGDHIGAGETGRTTAHLTEVLDSRYHVLESKFGRDGARAAAASSRAALDRIQAFVREFGDGHTGEAGEGACGFTRVPAYLYAESEDQRAELEKELASLQRVGCDAAWTDACPLPWPVRGAVRIEGQGKLHPIEYLHEMSSRLIAAGGRIFEGTRMCDVEDGEPCRVNTTGGTLTAKDVLVMTNAPTSSRFALHTKIAAYRTYAIAVRLPQPFPPGLFWDLQDPYHYLRSHHTAIGTFLIIGGEDHKTGKETDTDARFARLAAYTRTHFPEAQVSYQWSGQIIEPSDGLPFIGKNAGAEHVYVATGFSGNGMTFGTLSGMILADAVVGVANPWAKLYRATRIKPLAQVREYVAENVDYPATLARDRLAASEVAGVHEIPRGQGRLLREHGKMLAVYRDQEGALHARSAVCTHLGCHVRWNNAESSWDCPCHGSRFGVNGAVVNGPATKELAEAHLDEAPAVRVE
jgi:glycine/D-amino acid oxidase-like deaminating enzyme/nitrite reductase/ring-hydroxylating ferredoxin subunit